MEHVKDQESKQKTATSAAQVTAGGTSGQTGVHVSSNLETVEMGCQNVCALWLRKKAVEVTPVTEAVYNKRHAVNVVHVMLNGDHGENGVHVAQGVTRQASK